ncbi:MAG: type III-A CRISPR-associated RAMP protein Csm3 [Minisyncoccia bacterium]
MNKIQKNLIINWKIEVLTGLHIGGIKEGVKIGGTDNPVIKTYVKYKKNENDKGTLIELPYIPGSSIKGKMRSLLEYYYYGQEDRMDLIKKMFGVSPNEKNENDSSQKYFTRVIFRDAYPTIEWIEKLATEDIYQKGIEIKGENNIVRETGMANPRFIERVIPGIEFQLETILTIYEGDDENALLNMLKEGFKLLQDSYLGGNGTRGYGKIKVEQIGEPAERNISYYETSLG